MKSAMGAVTGAILAAFGLYAVAWYSGAVEGNFSLLLMLATLVTGIYWVIDKLVFLPQRRRVADHLVQEHQQRKEALAKQGFSQIEGDIEPARQRALAQPWWLDWTAGLFPVILAVFVLRSFLFEPFKIPSGSMIPTLRVGDLILVNKYHYGIRLPVLNTKVWDNHAPQRGDVIVFRYPPKPSLDYIKRVVGLPGDEVAYLNKQLTVNGQPVPRVAQPDFFDKDSMRYAKQWQESLGGKHYNILNEDTRPAFVEGVTQFPFADGCRYSVEGMVCKVPAGHYFMMYWGFVPEANIVGKAFFVWMNFGDFGRIGSFE
jgi:signal peptidase I